MPYKDPAKRKRAQREANLRWRAKHPEWKERRKELPSYGNLYGSRPTDAAAAAHEAVSRAIRKGILVRPSACSECGKEGFIEAAHKDYDQKLRVIWLCRSCHRLMDATDPNHGRTTEPRKGRKRLTDDERRTYRAAWMRESRAKQKWLTPSTETITDGGPGLAEQTTENTTECAHEWEIQWTSPKHWGVENRVCKKCRASGWFTSTPT